MTVLLDAAALARPRATVAGALAPLADSLAAELDRLLPGGDPFIPAEKARLTRAGGRCAADGALLEFDPRSPRRHRCPQCGAIHEGEDHYRWWVMGYQLWLAERAVHAAALAALRGEARHRQLAEAILTGLADRYASYPNVDNVLGPTRLFFSTYLESLWLVQVSVALDTLEAAYGVTAIGGAVRDRILAPSAHLIASFDEGGSNRQVWNNAAIAAAGRLLGRPEWVEDSVYGPSGLVAHLSAQLLPDGTWYEGENYHLFAHRGLWYSVTIAERASMELPADLVRRFQDGFAAPFLTALPDFTFPSRRDSQYGVSLRQWRMAEMCELGLARSADERLSRALGQLYREDVPTGDTARWRSTADAERNVPGARLTRADLGWKSMLFAAAEPHILADTPASSALLEGQGLAILRRGGGDVYVALDYGASGGGHGHPDRLNLWLVNGAERVLEDVGTGSYVDPALHWYRSTLAHNAPLVNGYSQARVDGRLRAWEEGGDTGWVSAEAEPAPQVHVSRSVVVRPSYLVDVLEWRAPHDVTLDLPIHAPTSAPPSRVWEVASLPGGDGEEDGFSFVERAEHMTRAERAGVLALTARGARGWVITPHDAEWWRCLAPGPPGSPPRWFHLVRHRGSRGRIVSVWTWNADLRTAVAHGESIVAEFADGSRDEHAAADGAWRIREHRAGAVRDVRLGGARARVPGEQTPAPVTAPPPDASFALPLLPSDSVGPGELTRGRTSGVAGPAFHFRLGRDHYRRSEQSWHEAGSPEALVSMGANSSHVLIEVSVRKPNLCFAAPRETNPLDNEHPDLNSDGVQLHILRAGAVASDRPCTWLIVPDPASSALRITPRSAEAASIPVEGSWRRTARGYQLLLRVPRAACGAGSRPTCRLDLLINEISPGRERRRGQLVLSGARGEWVYLRGDRHDPARFLTFSLPDA